MSDEKERLGRRIMALRVAAFGVAVPGAAAMAQGPKSGFRPAPQQAPPSGTSDSDPTDPAGQGRGGASPGGASDSDPSDPPGRGRGAGPRAGLSDSDPSDPPGQGRGGAAPRGASDSDPSDPVGQGRGGRPVEKSA